MVFLWAGAACGGTDATGNGDGLPAGMRTGYPGGPFGTSEGAVLANHEFVNPDGSKFSFADVHAEKKNKLLLLSTSAGWCTACIEEQPALKERHTRWSAKGLYILISLFEDAQFRAAGAELADKWQRQYDLPFKVVADPPFLLKEYYDETLTPMNMIVDVETMKILRITTGWDASAVDAILESKL